MSANSESVFKELETVLTQLQVYPFSCRNNARFPVDVRAARWTWLSTKKTRVFFISSWLPSPKKFLTLRFLFMTIFELELRFWGRIRVTTGKDIKKSNTRLSVLHRSSFGVQLILMSRKQDDCTLGERRVKKESTKAYRSKKIGGESIERLQEKYLPPSPCLAMKIFLCWAEHMLLYVFGTLMILIDN